MVTSCQQVHVWLHPTFIFKIICILFDQFVALSHIIYFCINLITLVIFIQKQCDDKQNLRGRIDVVALQRHTRNKPCMNFTQGLQEIGLNFAFSTDNVRA